jgi:hypothetical protein
VALSPWLIYLLGVNLFLNTPLASYQINRRPEKFRIAWILAVSPWPGLVYLRGVETRGQSRVIQWSAHLDAVTTSFQVRPLFRRTVRMNWVRAEGAVYRQRKRLAPGGERDPQASEFPTIPGLSNPPRTPPESLYPVKPPGRAWRIVADRIDCGLGEIWINRYRLDGTMSARTQLDMTVRGSVDLGAVRFEVSEGRMRTGKDPVLEKLHLLTDARIDPLRPKGLAPAEVLQAVSGDFSIEAGDARFAFLEAYFRKVPWLHLRGTGPLKMDLRLDRGKLVRGTHFRLERDNMDAQFLDRRITGAGYAEGEVVPAESGEAFRLRAVVNRYDVAEISGKDPFMSGRDFEVTATSSSLDLTQPFTDLKVTVDLPQSDIPDMSFYNRYIPAESRLSILSGAGRVRMHFEGSQEEQSLHGDVLVTMKDLKLKFESITLSCDITISARLQHGDPREGRFEISGTRVDLLHAKPRWTGRIELPRSVIWFSQPVRMEASLKLALQDTRPIVIMFDAHHDVPTWVENLMTIEGVAGGARLAANEKTVEVRDLEITGKGLRTLADMDFSDAGRSGILYLRFHGFSLGVERSGGKRDFKFIRPLNWFEKTRGSARKAATESQPKSPEANPGTGPATP